MSQKKYTLTDEHRAHCGRFPGMASDRCGAVAKFSTLLDTADCQRHTIIRLRQRLANAESALRLLRAARHDDSIKLPA